MSNTAEQFDYMKLNVDDRIRLAQDIWDSVVSEGAPIELTEEQRAELQRRMDDYKTSPESFPTWEEVMARLQSKQQ